jgi:peptidoglycan-associated lipoprotein
MKKISCSGIAVLILLLFGCAKKETLNDQLAVKPDTAAVAPGPFPETKPAIDQEALRAERLGTEAAQVLQTIYFSYDSYMLSDEARTVLARIGEFMKSYSEISLTVGGHCDERGSTEYNMALGQNRADEAKKYLVSYGVNGSRISTISWGEEKPAEPGDSEAVWAKNRRDEFSYNK